MTLSKQQQQLAFNWQYGCARRAAADLPAGAELACVKLVKHQQSWLVVCGCEDGSVLVYELMRPGGTLALLGTIRRAHQSAVSAVELLADDDAVAAQPQPAAAQRPPLLLVSADERANMRVFSMATGRCEYSFELAHRRAITALAFVRASTGSSVLLVSGSAADGVVSVWRWQTRDLLGSLSVGPSVSLLLLPTNQPSNTPTGQRELDGQLLLCNEQPDGTTSFSLFEPLSRRLHPVSAEGRSLAAAAVDCVALLSPLSDQSSMPQPKTSGSIRWCAAHVEASLLSVWSWPSSACVTHRLPPAELVALGGPPSSPMLISFPAADASHGNNGSSDGWAAAVFELAATTTHVDAHGRSADAADEGDGHQPAAELYTLSLPCACASLIGTDEILVAVSESYKSVHVLDFGPQEAVSAADKAALVAARQRQQQARAAARDAARQLQLQQQQQQQQEQPADVPARGVPAAAAVSVLPDALCPSVERPLMTADQQCGAGFDDATAAAAAAAQKKRNKKRMQKKRGAKRSGQTTTQPAAAATTTSSSSSSIERAQQANMDEPSAVVVRGWRSSSSSVVWLVMVFVVGLGLAAAVQHYYALSA
eukprot:TRINITY_DN323_c1_g1_i8.p1 TRINITY_DN323_c1_g1~~TRINITY_DN323_c1_g1_i8.p1  ORF type:complete len:595 (+),score=236.13 TRINITY_DN323_c1_g1_i8:161-1945(+)